MKHSGARSLQISSRPRAVYEGKNCETKIVGNIRFYTTLFRKVIRFYTLCFAKFFPMTSPDAGWESAVVFSPARGARYGNTLMG